jgi:NTP pyrophosphatase (non-canonical NTP hydrolase)
MAIKKGDKVTLNRNINDIFVANSTVDVVHFDFTLKKYKVGMQLTDNYETAYVSSECLQSKTTPSNPFDMVMGWRRAMGLPSNNIENLNQVKRMELHRNLFLEEMHELLYGIDTKDLSEIKDGFADLIFVLVGMMDELGENPTRIMEAVYESNMSKVCKSEQEAKQTVEAYANGSHPNKMGKKIAAYYEPVKGSETFVVKRKSDDKVLKSVNFKEPNL